MKTNTLEKEFPILIWMISGILLLIALILVATLIILANHVGCLLMEPKDEKQQSTLKRYSKRTGLVSLAITISIVLLCALNQTLRDFFLTKEFIVCKLLFLPFVGLVGFGLAFVKFKRKKVATIKKPQT